MLFDSKRCSALAFVSFLTFSLPVARKKDQKHPTSIFSSRYSYSVGFPLFKQNNLTCEINEGEFAVFGHVEVLVVRILHLGLDVESEQRVTST